MALVESHSQKKIDKGQLWPHVQHCACYLALRLGNYQELSYHKRAEWVPQVQPTRPQVQSAWLMDGQTDGWPDRCWEYLPILKDFSLYQGRCPAFKSKIQANKEKQGRAFGRLVISFYRKIQSFFTGYLGLEDVDHSKTVS